MSRDWEKMLRKTMEDHSELPPENLWEDIEKELFPEEQEKQFVFLKPPKLSSQSSLFSLDTFFKAAAIVVMVFTSYSILTFPNSEKSVAKVEISKDKSAVIAPKKNDENVFAEKLEAKEFLSFKGTKVTEPLKTVKETKSDFLSIEKEELSDFNLPEPLKPLLATKESNLDLPQFLNVIKEELTTPKAKRKLVASVLAGQVASTASHQNPGYTSMSSTPLGVQTSALGSSVLTILERTAKEDISTKIKHKSPVQFGLGLQYPLSEKLTLSTGVLYTKLVSELESGSDSKYINSVQTLHYLGVPVQMNYTFFEKNKLSAYSSLGVTAERSIAGKLENQYKLQPIVEEVQTKKIEDKTVQFSANLLVGVQFKVNNNVGIYLEPGLHYYVPNSSKATSLYNEKPFLVNTRMGLRFTLDR